MTITFVPGVTTSFKQIYTYTVFKNFNTCACIKARVDRIKTGWNDPTLPNNIRRAQILTNNLGGKTMFGNFGIHAKVNFVGRVEGQPGGSGKALRNNF